ncbi:MAG: CRISPR-associated helicase Cas3', partial [Thermoflexales bacterium]
GAPRLFYTLPYQASMNAMAVRLKNTFGSDTIGLAHGRALLALYRLIGEEKPDRADAEQQARRRMNLTRLHHLPVQIFSPYQMLKAMYRLKGYEGMLTDYDGAAFILDEIHAYDADRLALIIETLRYLRAHYAARFFVMSATFPSLIRARLDEALGGPRAISAAPELYARFCRHRIGLIEGEMFDGPNWERILEAVGSGRSALVCANTVGRAQRAKQQLRAAFPDLEIPLLHGRLNGRDRLARERIVREASGTGSQRRRPIALVATQTVEVSLDIDLDTIYTDPAPLEALIQRFGRVNRRRQQAEPAVVHVFSLPDDGQRIYDARLVQSALEILRREDGQPIPENAVGGWLDEIYAGDAGKSWIARYEAAATGFRNAVIHSLRPFNSEDRLEEQFYAAFDGIDVLPLQFEAEYVRLMDEDPLQAQELFVSIRKGQYAQIAKAGRLRGGKYPVVVDVPYDEGDDGIGLDLSVLKTT